MPRPRWRPDPQQGPDGYWHVYVPVGRHPNGRLKRKHVKRTSYEAAEDAAYELLDQVKAGPTPQSGRGRTLSAWLDTYITTVLPRRNVSHDSIYRYRSLKKNWIDPYIGHKRLDAVATDGTRLEPEDIDGLYAHMAKVGRKGATQYSVHMLLHGALEVAHVRGHATRNVAKLVETPDPEQGRAEISPLSLDEAKRILAALAGRRNAARFLVALVLGARRGECLGLRWSNVDHKRKGGDIRIEWQLVRRAHEHGCDGACGRKQARRCPKGFLPLATDGSEIQLHGGLILKRPKAGSVRAVGLPDKLWEALRFHRRTQAAERLRAGTNLWAEHDLVFATEFGQPIDLKADQKEWTALLKAAKVEHTKLHNARHTAATMVLVLGGTIEQVQEILGHTTEAMSREYVHVAEELKASESGRSATESIGRALWS